MYLVRLSCIRCQFQRFRCWLELLSSVLLGCGHVCDESFFVVSDLLFFSFKGQVVIIIHQVWNVSSDGWASCTQSMSDVVVWETKTCQFFFSASLEVGTLALSFAFSSFFVYFRICSSSSLSAFTSVRIELRLQLSASAFV